MFKSVLLLALVAVALGDRYHPRQFNDPRIVGGEEASIEDYPYQVSLRYLTSHRCGASILDSTTILTAAQCMYGRKPSAFAILAGTSYINDNTHPGILGLVASVIIHENYNTTTKDNDIAILKLTMPLVFTDKIKPIVLQDTNVVVQPKTVATVTGFGRMEEGEANPPGPFRLHKVQVSVIDHTTCETTYAKYGYPVTSNMFCAQTSGGDSCQAYYGGPLMAGNKLIGVVSWGIGCARPDIPRVYTQISALRPWIEKNMK